MKGCFDICKRIRAYQSNVPKNKLWQDSWEIFWDYKRGLECKGQSIFSDKNVDLTSMHLFIYLTCFGMTRGSTRLSNINLNEFTEIVRNIEQGIMPLLDTSFEGLEESHREKYWVCYDLIEKELSNKSVSSTETMITKILMALWGQTPAYDTRFFAAFNEHKKEMGWTRGDDYFDYLLLLRDNYDKYWEGGFRDLELVYMKTLGGHNIPAARLIDMAFWVEGERILEKKAKLKK